MDKNPRRDEKGKGLRKKPWKTKLNDYSELFSSW